MTFRVPELYRMRAGVMASTAEDGNNGMFFIPANIAARRPLALRCKASDGDNWNEIGLPPPAWEHVSVSTATRCPTWEEMCFVKSIFWGPEDVVIQLHPRESEYVNCHPHCLHLWRPVGVAIPTPPFIAIGPAVTGSERKCT